MKKQIELLTASLTLMAILYVATQKAQGVSSDTYFTHPYGGINKMDSTGQISAVLPNVGRATGLAFDNSGDLYFGKFYDDGHKIDLMKLSPKQELTNLGTIVEVGTFVHKWDIDLAVNDNGEVYFTHPYGGIWRVDATGQVSVGVPDVGTATGLIFDDDGNSYFGERYDHTIDLKKATGEDVTNLGRIVEVGPVVLRMKIDLAVNDMGEVYFNHPYGGIHKMDSTGQIRTVLPDVGRATGLAFDNDGNLYFGKFYYDYHKLDLMKMSPDQRLTNLGMIIEVGPTRLTWNIDIAVISEPVPAEVRIAPRTINLASKNKWITCYIWLPEAYNVADIDPNSVVLEYEIEPELLWLDEEEQVAIVRFSRSEVQEILEPGDVELTISGELSDWTRFEGTDTIRIIDKGGKNIEY